MWDSSWTKCFGFRPSINIPILSLIDLSLIRLVRAMTPTVSRCLVIVEDTGVRSLDIVCGIYGEKVALGQVYLVVLRFLLSVSFHRRSILICPILHILLNWQLHKTTQWKKELVSSRGWTIGPLESEILRYLVSSVPKNINHFSDKDFMEGICHHLMNNGLH